MKDDFMWIDKNHYVEADGYCTYTYKAKTPNIINHSEDELVYKLQYDFTITIPDVSIHVLPGGKSFLLVTADKIRRFIVDNTYEITEVFDDSEYDGYIKTFKDFEEEI